MAPFPYPRFLLALLAALAMGWVLARWLGPRGFMDVPSGRRNHEFPVPRTAGLAFWILVVAGHLGGILEFPLRPMEWAGLGVLVLVGFLDDRFGLRARWKALAGLAVALIIAVPGAMALVAMKPNLHLLGLHIPPLLPVGILLLTILYWSIPHAFNLIDGAHGLAMGYALIVLGFLAAAGSPRPAAMGLLVGLLAFNWPRAKHFLGDCGSLGLGLLLALLAKKAVGATDPNLVLWLFAYPIVDTSLVVAIRLSQGRNLGEGDRSHLHHQWGDRFPGLRACVAPLLWAQAALCASAVVVRGAWWILPWTGAGLLLGQALYFYWRALNPRATLQALKMYEDPVTDHGESGTHNKLV
ncbi:MAG: undecaprenyl/decaprenyl-phosphate alpha-N-acetylglucosaminyl 1-phosphate transferase [Acidobacteria bacterium]|nr:undecaprenyl/decaprenyl-phosphate alpha-N-acetylglucosaminyl 1-phosphate transferase [Acidobacteriota bacterium]